MNCPNKEILEKLRNSYTGKTVELLAMPDDPHPVPVGTKGIVRSVDDAGHICVNWENGSTLRVIFEAGDHIKIL